MKGSQKSGGRIEYYEFFYLYLYSDSRIMAPVFLICYGVNHR